MKHRNAVTLLIFLTIFSGPVHSIDTEDWAGILTVLFSMGKPEKEWVLNTAETLLVKQIGAYPEKEKTFFSQFFNEDSSQITVPIKNGHHDLKEIYIDYMEANQGGYIYIVWFSFLHGKMSLLDVLGRYGTDLAEIKTKEDLSKEINYVLKTDMPSLVGDNPIWPLQPSISGQITTLKFISKDKVFVDDLVISFYKP